MAPTNQSTQEKIIPGAYDARFFGFFAWYVRRLLSKRFFAVRIVRGSSAVLGAVARTPGPIIVALNHPSWWDPLVGVLLHHSFMPDRHVCGPIDSRELARFRFMRKLGLFGVDPDDPDALSPMVDHAAELLSRRPNGAFWITPQGAFTDVREEVKIRPGVSALAARIGPAAVSLAIEYGFWTDQRPEVFLSVQPVETPASATTAGWHRTFTRAMRANAAALADLVRTRDASAFETFLGGGSRIHPVYDLWLRVTGRGNAIGRPSEIESLPPPRTNAIPTVVGRGPNAP